MSETTENRKRTPFDWLEPYRWKKGQSGNPGGRPKNSLKSFAAAEIAGWSPERKRRFLNEVSKELAWRMAEGNPDTKEHHEHSGEIKMGESYSAEVIAFAKKELKKRKTDG